MFHLHYVSLNFASGNSRSRLASKHEAHAINMARAVLKPLRDKKTDMIQTFRKRHLVHMRAR